MPKASGRQHRLPFRERNRHARVIGKEHVSRKWQFVGFLQELLCQCGINICLTYNQLRSYTPIHISDWASRNDDGNSKKLLLVIFCFG